MRRQTSARALFSRHNVTCGWVWLSAWLVDDDGGSVRLLSLQSKKLKTNQNSFVMTCALGVFRKVCYPLLRHTLTPPLVTWPAILLLQSSIDAFFGLALDLIIMLSVAVLTLVGLGSLTGSRNRSSTLLGRMILIGSYGIVFVYAQSSTKASTASTTFVIPQASEG